MTTPDWQAIGAGVGSGIIAVLGKVGWDKARGGNGSALKEKFEAHVQKVDAHIEDDTSKFAALTTAMQKSAEAAVETNTKTLLAIGEVAKDVAFIRGQLSKD